MNRLIIVGNGFDLSLRLKTGYNHFLTHYIQELVLDLFERSKTSSSIVSYEKLGNVYETYDDLILIKIPDYFFRDSEKEKFINKIKKFEVFRDIIKFLNVDGSVEFKSILLREIHQSSELRNWIDIEVLYFDTLISIYRRYEGKPDLEDRLRKYNENFQLLKSKLIEYLKEIKIDNERYNVNFYVDNYFEKLISPYNNSYRVNKVMFLNFNYTRSLESLKKNYFGNDNFTINHIHGDITDPETIIFGFGDESEKNYLELKNERSKELHKNIKRYHYYKDTKYDELKSFLDSDNFEVWIIGHSCGISDKTIFSDILENVNCESIRIFHHSKDNPKGEFHDKSIEIMKSFSLTSGKVPKLNFNKDDVIFQLHSK
ncbi:MAG: hypothetical protein HQ522_07520 [Bacteroidetes bacterium]|nr:hypothetical protein [Bacteroidota bacterium]